MVGIALTVGSVVQTLRVNSRHNFVTKVLHFIDERITTVYVHTRHPPRYIYNIFSLCSLWLSYLSRRRLLSATVDSSVRPRNNGLVDVVSILAEHHVGYGTLLVHTV